MLLLRQAVEKAKPLSCRKGSILGFKTPSIGDNEKMMQT